MTIDVTASKWEWTFTYPAIGFSVRSGTVGRQPLVVPADEAVRFNLTSVDVIHSFWIPALRYKHDAIPGSIAGRSRCLFSRGVFPGQCAEFCGLRHADMIFTAHAVSPATFAAWAQSGGTEPDTMSVATATPAADPTHDGMARRRRSAPTTSGSG